MMHKVFKEHQIAADLKCQQWNEKNRTIRKFDDGSIIYFWRGVVDFTVHYHAKSCTGQHWDAEICYLPDLKNQHKRIRLWACGETRREAIKALRDQIKGYRELLTMLGSR